MMCSETPLGAPTERWRFPARNRVIAALSQIVVVVESHDKGGSLYTAHQAMDRGRTVFAVPGPIHSSSSAGCNRLLLDGCLPLCELADVLVALGLATPTFTPSVPVEVDQLGHEVVDVVGWRPTSLDQICAALGVGGSGVHAPLSAGSPPSLDHVAFAIEVLVAKGVLAWRGRWLERTPQQVVLVVPGADGLPDAT
jgi:predicted Rossmann fold nucleotide-binding protein DprA/Smf involved in DNA uptake